MVVRRNREVAEAARESAEPSRVGSWRAYVLAIVMTAAVVAVRISLQGTLDDNAPLLVFMLSVTLAASKGGLRPGLFATALGGLAGTYFFLPPAYSLELGLTADSIQLLIYLISGTCVSVLSERMHRAHHEAKRSVALLEEQLKVTKTITDNASAALFMIDESGVCTFANPAAEAMTGFTLAEFRQRPLHKLIHHHRADGRPYPISECPLGRVIRGNFDLRTYEDVFIRKNGEPFPVFCIASAIPADRGPPSTVIEVRDITEQKRIEQEREILLGSERAARAEAERASRLKDEFVATVSHELRTPLNAILGWTQLLVRSGRTPEHLDRGLEIIDRNTRLQAQLISDLLDVSRIVAGKLLLEVQRVDLPPIIEGALESVRNTAKARGIQLREALEPVEQPVRGDPGRLQQVVWNLMSNAIKFTPAGGQVDIRLSQIEGHAVISVSDTGQGIPPEFLPHVFDRFRQADATAARRHGGLGLGLSIAKHVVEVHGGRIWAESEGAGKGARFTVELPLLSPQEEAIEACERAACAAPEAAGRGPALREAAAPLRGVKVMVVEDEPDARELVRRVLEECEAEVVTASSAPEALDALVRYGPDVLVSDLGMPGMDGYTLIREIRAGKVKVTRDLPALALTAFARPEDRERALLAGYHAHLAKPTEPSELVAMVVSLSGQRRVS